MKILITSGLSGKDVGGPAQYGPNLKENFKALGHEARLVSYGRLEKFLPTGLRHACFTLRAFPHFLWAEKILALDTYSVGAPSVMLAGLLKRKITLRVGGDFLFSAYLNRTSDNLTLKEFYLFIPKLNLKERIILTVTKKILREADFLAFNTVWQMNIWKEAYSLESNRLGVVRNFMPERGETPIPEQKNFLWAGRIIPEKNISILKKAAEKVSPKHKDFSLEIVTNEPREKILEKIKESYCVVSPALTDICPNFILEGISFNKPFLMTRETGLSELFPKGGEFLDPKNEKAWEVAIERMLDYNVYREHKAEIARNPFKHSWQDVAGEFADIWKKN